MGKNTITFRGILYAKSVIDKKWFNRFIFTVAEKKELEKQGVVFPKKEEPKQPKVPKQSKEE